MCVCVCMRVSMCDYTSVILLSLKLCAIIKLSLYLKFVVHTHDCKLLVTLNLLCVINQLNKIYICTLH